MQCALLRNICRMKLSRQIGAVSWKDCYLLFVFKDSAWQVPAGLPLPRGEASSRSPSSSSESSIASILVGKQGHGQRSSQQLPKTGTPKWHRKVLEMSYCSTVMLNATWPGRLGRLAVLAPKSFASLPFRVVSVSAKP